MAGCWWEGLEMTLEWRVDQEKRACPKARASSGRPALGVGAHLTYLTPVRRPCLALQWLAGLVGPSGANAAPARPHCMSSAIHSSPGAAVHEPHLRLVLGLIVPL